jgi:type II secretory pathway pseudopilin PulG
MVVGVGIIVVLVLIALPNAYGLISDSRAKQTKATMDTIAVAIERFNRDNPFVHNDVSLRGFPNPNLLPPLILHAIPQIFDRYPPSPTTAFSVYPLDLGTFVAGGLGVLSPPYPATKENDDDPPATTPTQNNTAAKFHRLIHVLNRTDTGFHRPCDNCVPWLIQDDKQRQIRCDQQQFTEHYASIECLVYALRKFSPGAQAIIDKLPSSLLTNLDKDFTFHDVPPPGSTDPCGNGQYDPGWESKSQDTLFEIVDAWKRPIRYAIRERWQPTPTSGFTFKWELRSAGEDGIFSPPFTPAVQSDDVILQGP